MARSALPSTATSKKDLDVAAIDSTCRQSTLDLLSLNPLDGPPRSMAEQLEMQSLATSDSSQEEKNVEPVVFRSGAKDKDLDDDFQGC